MDFYLQRNPKPDASPAHGESRALADEAVDAVNAAKGASWYDEIANPADRAAVMLCRLRRAAAGRGRDPATGDAAVRLALEEAELEAVIWLASRTISYMDEQGYPETLAAWLDE
jgi:hypothetical protein